jgi:hypothetical protein
MTNLLEQAINCNDGDRAAKIIRDALGIESNDVASYCFPEEWPTNRASSAPASSVNGCIGRPATLVDDWLVDGRPLPAAVVCRGTTCVPQKKTRRAGHDAAGKLGVSVKKRGEPTTDSLVRLKPILRRSG